METIDLKKYGVVELSLDESKEIDGGIWVWLLLGYLVGVTIAMIRDGAYK